MTPQLKKTLRTAVLVAAIAPTPILVVLVASGIVKIEPKVKVEKTEVLQPLEVVQYRNLNIDGQQVNTHNLDCATVKHDDLVCLTCNIYEESRNQPLAGQILVAKTVMNRALASKQSLCNVVWANKQYSWTNAVPVQYSVKIHNHKFSKTMMQRPVRMVTETDAWRKALEVAHLTLAEYGQVKKNDVDVVVMADGQDSTDIKWYHTQQVSPEWRKGLKQVDVVGDHVFYTSPNKTSTS